MLLLNASSRALWRAAGALGVAAMLHGSPLRADEIQDAARMFRGGQHQQALERVNKILSARPKDPQARFLKGLIHTEQGNTSEAIDAFQRLTQDYPELPEPYNNLAVIYAAQGQYEKARAALEQSIRTHPSYATAYENLGDVYAKLASQAYDRALQIDSANAGAQNKLSLVRELVGGASTGRAAGAKTAVAAATPATAAQKPAAAPAEPPKAPAATAAEPAAAAAKAPPAKGGDQVAMAAKAAGKPAAGDASAEVLKAVQAWADAWSKQNVDGYLGAYAKEFDPPGRMSRAAWEKQRRERVSGPKSISVTLSDFKVKLEGDAAASVTFHQDYQSDRFSGGSMKTLNLVKSGGRWLIREEKVSN